MSLTCRIILFAVSFLIGGREISSSLLSHFDKQDSSLAEQSDDAANWLFDSETSGSGEEEDLDESALHDFIDIGCTQHEEYLCTGIAQINQTVDLSFSNLSVLFRNLRL